MTPSDMAYRMTAAEGGSGFGLLIALYDRLASDLQRAAEAQRENDIERRCLEINHAFRVIGLLQDSVNRGPGGELAQQLLAFYASMRRKLITAQAEQSAGMLEQAIDRVLKIREAWQEAGMGEEQTDPGMPPSVALKESAVYPSYQTRNSAGNWSA